jgi:hypothetical protein
MLMARREFRDQRKALRYTLERYAKISSRTASLPRDCLIVDISDSGIRIHAENVEVPDDFTIQITGISNGRRECRVIWRLGFEIGAEFSDLRRGFAERLAGLSDQAARAPAVA